jgi:non-lysosomal glucosylceramidase
MAQDKGMPASRRDFFRAALAIPCLMTPVSIDGYPSLVSSPTARHEDERENSEHSSGVALQDIEFPRVFTGRKLSRISLPLGGIGTGGIGLGGRGNLMDWDIFNRPNKAISPESGKGNYPEFCFPALWVKIGEETPRSVIVERRLLPPYDLTPETLGSDNVPGLPRLAEATFMGSFPVAKIDFEDNDLPVRVSLDAFSSFHPIDADLSGLPCAVLSYEVQNPADKSAEVVISWSIENPLRKFSYTADGLVDVAAPEVDPRTNQVRRSSGLQGIVMTDSSLTDEQPLKGSFVLAVLDEENGQSSVQPYWPANDWRRVGIQRFWFDYFSKTGSLGPEVQSRSPIGSVAMRQVIPAGGSRRYRFLLSWHFPNRTPSRCGWEAPKGKENAFLGNYYCTRFSDAWAVAEHVQQNFKDIEQGTHSFVQVLQTSTLSPAVMEAATANLSTLVSNTSFRMADGSFHGFEGCGDAKAWGFGSCTHVWNYEVATQFLFPVLSQSMRSTSFGYATDSDGRMDFRHKLPIGEEHWGPGAADGQMGQIVKLCLDWKLSGDTAWLRKLWPACKRALQYAWRPGGWDGDQDGVMEGVQHNTYDIEFYGPNPMCESWYLAALRACHDMGIAIGDNEFAERCKRLFAEGSRWTDAHLFNGEYYVQQVRGVPESQIAAGLRWGQGAKDTLHPDFQIGAGCLLDQLLGQYMASLAGLGPLLDTDHMRTTLRSIFRYNYKHPLYQQESVQRTFALNDEAALILCDYTKSEPPQAPMPYYSENFTGSEYAAAVLMMKYGMVNEGIECIASIRKRFDGEKANPYCEAEWGRHYARAMASWGAIPALSGFLYDGVNAELEVKPLINVNEFSCFWSVPTAWGAVRQTAVDGRSRFLLEPRRGQVVIRRLRLDSSVFRGPKIIATVGDDRVPCSLDTQSKDSASFVFEQALRIGPASPLAVSVS